MHAILLAVTLWLSPWPGTGGQDTEAPASISGVVSGIGTNRPVTRAEVRLIGEQGGSAGTAATDGAGRFAFDGIAPGSYRLTLTRDGYVPAEYGQTRPNGPGQLLVVRPGERRNDLALRMTLTGVISGRVRDVYGEPVVNASVEALQFSYPEGRRVLTPVRNAMTNDLGEYRLFWMQPGEYVVRVSGAPGGFGALGAGLQGGSIAAEALKVQVAREVFQVDARPTIEFNTPETNFVFAPDAFNSLFRTATGSAAVYYPGTTDPAQAVSVDLAAGAEFPGVDMVLAEETATRISGRVIHGAGGALPPGVTVTLVSRSDLLVQGSGQMRVPATADGSFEILNVPPGSYDLSASLSPIPSVRYEAGEQPGEVRIVTGAPNDNPLFAHMPVEVRSGAVSIDNLVLELAPGFELTGRLTAPAGTPVDFAGVRVALRGERTTFGVGPAPGPVNPDGTFTISGLPPSDYRLMVQGLPPGAYVQEARLGTLDALNNAFRIDAGVRSVLDILLGSGPGRVDVAVFSPAQERLPGTRVVLVPDPARRGRSDLYRAGISDANGVVQFQNVEPGDYKVFVWDLVPEGAWQNTGFLRPYENSGIPVRVVQGGTELVNATLLP